MNKRTFTQQQCRLRDLPPFSPEVEEAASADDAAWFRDNVGATERVRSFAPGEAPVGSPPCGHRWAVTLVRQVEPGARIRQFIAVPRADLLGGVS